MNLSGWIEAKKTHIDQRNTPGEKSETDSSVTLVSTPEIFGP